MNKEIIKVDERDILKYWLELFPELENEQEFLELIQKVNRVDIEELMNGMLKEYNNETEYSEEGVDINLDDRNLKGYNDYVPFYNFFIPIVNPKINNLKKELLKHTIIHDIDRFADIVVKYTLDSLFELSYRVIILEVNICRLEGKLKGATPKERIEYFSNILLRDKGFIAKLYFEYKPLLEVLNRFIDNYFEFILEILEETEQNLISIQKNVNNDKALGKIVSIETGIGDGHKGGKAVSIINFTEDIKIVYKPRSLELDNSFNVLLSWVERKNAKDILDFKKIKLFTNDDSGWMEFIENKACEKEEDIKRFYTRAGQYLCLLYILNSVDFHFENLIAEGEYPMLIDIEAIFHGKVKSVEKEANSGYVKAREDISASVNSISLLPTVAGNNEMSFDLGGLGGNEEQVIPIKSLFIDNIESDNLKIISRESILKPKSNNPIIDGEIVNSKKYINELKSGFTKIYKFIIGNKDEFSNVVKDIFSENESRLIIKATAFYANLLKISIHPDFMGNEYSRKGILHRVALSGSEYLKWTTQSEYDDLMYNDIPYFTVSINDTKVYNSKKEFKDNLLEESPMNSVIRKINNLSNMDLKKQLEYIDMSYLNMRKMEGDFTHLNYTIKTNKLTPNKWIKTAEEIGEYILEKSIDGINDKGNKDKFWISTSLQGFEENIWKPDVLSFDLYNGNSGIALFLGYLGKILGRDDFKKASNEAMEMSKCIIGTLKEDMPYSVGAFTGLTGVFYTIEKLYKLYGEKENSLFIKENTHKLVDCLKLDTLNDVIGGSAGSLAVALSMINSQSLEIQKAAMNLAQESYIKLVEGCNKDKDGVYWKSSNSMIYSGFSHGNAGIIAYLHKLNKNGNNDVLSSIIKDALAYERLLYSEKDKNWYTTNKKEKMSHGWCHGAPGVVLSKLMLKESGYNDLRLDSEIENGLNSLIKSGFGNNPTYCHGDLGNLAIVNYAAKVLKNDELSNMSVHAYQELFDNVLSKEWNRKKIKSSMSLSLMIGITGFGYSMLKNYEPDSVPEFLWLE